MHENRPFEVTDIMGIQKESKTDQLRDHTCSFSDNHNYLGHFHKSWYSNKGERTEWKAAMGLLEAS